MALRLGPAGRKRPRRSRSVGRRSYRRANERAERGSRGQRCVSARHARRMPRITIAGASRGPPRTATEPQTLDQAQRQPCGARRPRQRHRWTERSGECAQRAPRALARPTARTSWGPARCSCRRSRSSPLCKRADAWQSLVSSRGCCLTATRGSRRTTGSTATPVRGSAPPHRGGAAPPSTLDASPETLAALAVRLPTATPA